MKQDKILFSIVNQESKEMICPHCKNPIIISVESKPKIVKIKRNKINWTGDWYYDR